MKFKVRCTKTRDGRFILGKVYDLDKDGHISGDKLGCGDNPTDSFERWHRACGWRDYDFEPVYCNSKIVLTSDGTTTLARLYDGDKVIKSAEAKCVPIR
jgi:hypothetical protein